MEHERLRRLGADPKSRADSVDAYAPHELMYNVIAESKKELSRPVSFAQQCHGASC